MKFPFVFFCCHLKQLSGWPLVGNEGINLYIGILEMKLPSFPTKGQLQ